MKVVVLTKKLWADNSKTINFFKDKYVCRIISFIVFHNSTPTQ